MDSERLCIISRVVGGDEELRRSSLTVDRGMFTLSLHASEGFRFPNVLVLWPGDWVIFCVS